MNAMTAQSPNGNVAPLLEVGGLSYSVADKVILSDINFHMEPGEIRAVIGPNGAGKSSMVRCVAGVTGKTGGTVLLAGRSQDTVSRKELARLVCYMPQAQGGLPPFTVRDFVGMGRYAHHDFWHTSSRDDGDKIDAALSLAGVADLADRLLPTLSGGERQMAAIAAGLAQEAQLLVLDEPGTFLDPAHQDLLLELILRLNREQGLSLLVVTHDVNMAMHFTHRVLAIRSGSAVFDGASGDLAKDGVLADIYGTDFALLSLGEAGSRFAISRKYFP